VDYTGCHRFAGTGRRRFVGLQQRLANRNLENFLNNKYQRAFFDMTAQVQNLEVLLSRALWPPTPAWNNSLLMDIRQQSAFAQSNLGQLPLNDALSGRHRANS
jgi:hypothetical protein